MGFGDAGVWVSLNNGNGTFPAPQKVVDNFAYDAGGWRVEKHPRFLADLTGDGRADIVGLRQRRGVGVAQQRQRRVPDPTKVVDNFALRRRGMAGREAPAVRCRAEVTLGGEPCPGTPAVSQDIGRANPSGCRNEVVPLAVEPALEALSPVTTLHVVVENAGECHRRLHP